MSKIQFSVQVLVVSNLEQSRAFYQDVLGCEVNDWWAVRDDFRLGFKLIEAKSTEDIQPNKIGNGQEKVWDTYSYVETHHDLDELYKELKCKGAIINQEPELYDFEWGSWKEFSIKDPDHYIIAFGSGKKNE
ncbi:VOC family protein [Paenibacillus sp. KQZ6P-2]|uniref:VOC family protein n=1 Tax=Paenibacillus mangrovi TaxID=2931978 RepID=A0A9X2B7C5_9BACL|nr:VOC family protein [Paenibacillus mangrovi]MCJ8013563.1 VOC family protein [Paenibacillus mangrovi]